MQAAGNWRLGIQRQLLNQFATLGRPVMQSRNQYGGGVFGGAYISGGEVNYSGVALDGFVITMYNGQVGSTNPSSGLSHNYFAREGNEYGSSVFRSLSETRLGVVFDGDGEFFSRSEPGQQAFFESQSSLSAYNFEPASMGFPYQFDASRPLSSRSSAKSFFRTEARTRSVPVTRMRTETRTRNINGRFETYQVQVPYTEQVTQNYTVNVPYSNGYSSSIISDDRNCLLYTSPSPRDKRQSRMPSSA